MGCVHSDTANVKYAQTGRVETLYYAKRMVKVPNTSVMGNTKGRHNVKKAISKNTFDNVIIDNLNLSRADSYDDLDEDEPRPTFTIFPKWKGVYKMCNVCEKDKRKLKTFVPKKSRKDKVDHVALCNRCSDMLKELKNNLRQTESASVQTLDATMFANLLALTALDLTAPASDALLKNRKNAWIQLAGHPGSFAPAGPNTIWKRRITKDNTETKAYEILMDGEGCDIVPKFYREVEYKGEYFIEMEDLLQHFTDPNIMDIKLGRRTFLESEVTNPVLRKDLYEKMISLDPDAPTEQEREEKAITKLRYMQFRESESSSAEFGFRIEALRLSGEPPTTNLKKIRTKEQIKQILRKFVQENNSIQRAICQRLKYIQQKVESTEFFMTREIVGSSALVMYDKKGHIGVWLIDFSKTMPVRAGETITHRAEWVVGNHEDGFLIGVDKLIEFFEDIPDDDDNSSIPVQIHRAPDEG